MTMNRQKNIFKCPELPNYGITIKIIGIGAGALNILNKFPTKSIHKLEFIAIDTDQDALNNSKFAITLSVNFLTLNDKNNHSDFKTIRRAILDNAYHIGWLFKDANLTIIITYLGGETGSMVTPIIGNICLLESDLTLVFATTPAAFESQERNKRIEAALKELENAADTSFHIPMTDARFSAETTQTLEAFARFDEIVVRAVRAIAKTLYSPDGLFCVDFPDLKSVFNSRKKGYVALGWASGEGRLERILNDALG